MPLGLVRAVFPLLSGLGLCASIFCDGCWWLALVCIAPALWALRAVGGKGAVSSSLLITLPTALYAGTHLLKQVEASAGLSRGLSLLSFFGYWISISCVWMVFFYAVILVTRRGVLVMFLLLPAFYAGLEVACSRAYALVPLFGPYLQIGLSQATIKSPILQLADLVGVYGIGAILIAANMFVFLFPVIRFRMIFVITVLVMIASVLIYSDYQAKRNWSGQVVDVCVLGTANNLGKRQEVAYARFKNTLLGYYEACKSSRGDQPDVTVWPEMAVPFPIATFDEVRNELFRISRKCNSVLILGGRHFVQNDVGLWEGENGTYVIDAGEGTLIVRNKVIDSPFDGPGFMESSRKLWSICGFHLEHSGRRMEMSVHRQPICSVICFEALFTAPVRTSVLKGAEYIVQISNDVSVNSKAMAGYLVRHSILRAVETRRWVCRSANYGYTGFISPTGHSDLVFVSEGIQAGRKVIATREASTAYTKWGGGLEVFFLVSVAVVPICFVMNRKYGMNGGES